MALSDIIWQAPSIQSRHCTRTTMVQARVLLDLVVPFRGRTEGLFEDDVNVGLAHRRASRALLILLLEAERSARTGFDLIRLILWHHLDCTDNKTTVSHPMKGVVMLRTRLLGRTMG